MITSQVTVIYNILMTKQLPEMNTSPLCWTQQDSDHHQEKEKESQSHQLFKIVPYYSIKDVFKWTGGVTLHHVSHTRRSIQYTLRAKQLLSK